MANLALDEQETNYTVEATDRNGDNEDDETDE